MAGKWSEPTEVERQMVNHVSIEFVELMNRLDKEGISTGVILMGASSAIADAITSIHSPTDVPEFFSKQADLARSALRG